MELEISDDPHDCRRLDVSSIPVTVTMSKVLQQSHDCPTMLLLQDWKHEFTSSLYWIDILANLCFKLVLAVTKLHAIIYSSGKLSAVFIMKDSVSYCIVFSSKTHHTYGASKSKANSNLN